jgi:hypothetical protein
MSANTVLHTDPGPLARFRETIEDPTTLSVIVQRVTDGETLKDIAVAWKIPYGRLAEWLIEDRERSEQYNQALQIWSDSLAQESVKIADGGTEPGDVQRDKLRIDTRLKLASKLNRRATATRSSTSTPAACRSSRFFHRCRGGGWST